MNFLNFFEFFWIWGLGAFSGASGPFRTLGPLWTFLNLGPHGLSSGASGPFGAFWDLLALLGPHGLSGPYWGLRAYQGLSRPRVFGTFLADFCQVFLQNFFQKSDKNQKLNSKSLPTSSSFPNMCQNFAKKMLKVCQKKIICRKNDKCQNSLNFLAKYLPNNCKKRPKFFQKLAEKVPKSREIGIRIYV